MDTDGVQTFATRAKNLSHDLEGPHRFFPAIAVLAVGEKAINGDLDWYDLDFACSSY